MTNRFICPVCAEELRRTVKPGGGIITAIPARNHLYGLKTLLYKQPYYNEVKPYEIGGPEFVGKREIAYTLKIDNRETLNALFMMTPYYHKTSREDSSALFSYFDSHSAFETEKCV